jgi:hypothetical protein
MADKFEREIEEILAKLDDDLPPANGERSPISIAQKRQQKAKAQRIRTQRPNPLAGLTPTHLLFSGAGIMFGGLILSSFWGPLIWAAFAGVLLFIGAFFWSFRRTNRPATGTPKAKGYYWRDRYIEYEPTGSHTGQRIKSWFRRK